MLFAGIIFILSLISIVALFGVKAWEQKHARVLAPALRERADHRANQVKELAVAARVDLVQLWPAFIRLCHVLVHEAALAFAALARSAEKQSYRVADLVSHKHRFERRETRSEFLKKVAEHKNGGGQNEAEASLGENQNI